MITTDDDKRRWSGGYGTHMRPLSTYQWRVLRTVSKAWPSLPVPDKQTRWRACLAGHDDLESRESRRMFAQYVPGNCSHEHRRIRSSWSPMCLPCPALPWSLPRPKGRRGTGGLESSPPDP